MKDGKFCRKKHFCCSYLWILLVLFFFLPIVSYCQKTIAADSNELINLLSYEVIDIFPHDPAAFTQGLVWEDGFLYEGTGLYGSSSLRKVELKSGKVLQCHNLNDDYFGEGITIFNGRIYQLTWQEKTGFVYDKETFELLDTFTYLYEGWGITHDGYNLIISDGSPTIRFLDPIKMEEVRQLRVHYKGTPISNLNELEYIKGKIYANIWQTALIAVVDPDTGEVVSWINLGEVFISVKKDSSQKIDVLNGIAYNEEKDSLFVTGKLWPKIFEIKIHN